MNNKEHNMKQFNFRKAFGGGGNREKARDVVRGADLDAKMPRCIDAKSVTEKMYCYALLSKGEKVAVRAERVTDTREGLSYRIHPSPEFLNSLSFIKKFYPTPCWGEGKVKEVIHENSNNSHFHEKLKLLSVVIPSDSDGIQLINNQISMQGKKTIQSKQTTPLGIFASKSVSCRISKSDLHKKVAFTLAEVLITLGIIGVVAALTLPSVIHKYQTEVLKNQFKKSYSSLAQAVLQAREEVGVANFKSYCTIYTEKGYVNSGECSRAIFNQLKFSGQTCNYNHNEIYTYSKTQKGVHT